MKLVDFLICDDIRHEQGDKLSLMGVYGNSINLHIPKEVQKPIAWRFAVYLRVLVEDNDRIPDRCSVIFHDSKKELVNFNGPITISGRPVLLAFVLPHFITEILEDSALTAKITLSAEGQPILDVMAPYTLEVKITKE